MLPRSKAPTDDGSRTCGARYYASIFNPARVNLRAMRRELPVRHWPTLPEARLIPSLLADAPGRVSTA